MSCIFGKIPHAALIPMPSAHLIHAPTYKWTKSKNCSVCWEWVLNQLPNYFSSQKSWQVERRESNYSVYLTLRLSPTLDCVCALVIITMFSTYVTSDLRKSHVEQFSNGKSQKTGFFFFFLYKWVLFFLHHATWDHDAQVLSLDHSDESSPSRIT